MRGGHTGHAAKQYAHTALGFFQVSGTGLHGHAPGDFAHWREQRQAATGAGDGFVGDADGAGFDQSSGLLGIGREVQVGVENLARAQHGAFLGLRLLDLDDHVAGGKHGCRIRGQFSAGSKVFFIGEANGRARVVLHQNLVSAQREFAHAGRRQADTVLMVLDFLRHSDFHGQPLAG